MQNFNSIALKVLELLAFNGQKFMVHVGDPDTFEPPHLKIPWRRVSVPMEA